jgi:ribosome-binding protein aMBF1 (putative translation factor)
MKGELRMSDYRKSLNKNLKDPEFKKEWDNLEIEYQVQAELIRARLDSNMTQAELAQKSGIRQSNISRIENGNAIPRLDTLEALALAMGKKVKISIL